MNESILFVDDEIQILKSINRLFIDTNYKVHLATSGSVALQILSKNKIDMIISDIRMPNMSGCELLKIVKEKYPNVLRLVLSGYSDACEVLGALRDNLAKAYLLKPWDNRELLDKIKQIFMTEAIIGDKEVLDYINNLQDIPILPATYHKLCKLMKDEAGISDIINVVEQDPAMASKILHVANSSFDSSRTGSIEQAVRFLGLSNIKNIVFSSYVTHNNNSMSLHIKKAELCNHSYLCNKLLKLFYNRLLKNHFLKMRKLLDYFMILAKLF